MELRLQFPIPEVCMLQFWSEKTLKPHHADCLRAAFDLTLSVLLRDRPHFTGFDNVEMKESA